MTSGDAHADQFTVNTDDPLVARVRMRGDIDMTNAEILRAALERALRERRYVMVDAAEVDFMDSSGLTAMLHVMRHAPRDAITIHNPSAAVRHLLSMTAVDTILRIDG